MIKMDERYAYLRPLNRLQRFLLATQYDMKRRNWFGRTIEKGWIAVAPHTYNQEMLQNLLRYCLTIDRDEANVSAQRGHAARFQLVSPEQLIAIDSMWSLHGATRPFKALEIYRDIYVNKKSYPVPEVETFPRIPIPKPRWLKVGDAENSIERYFGLREPFLDVFGGFGCMGSRLLSDGETVLDMNSSPEFEVDLEGACFILDYDLDHLIEQGQRYEAWSAEAYRHYAAMGTISVSPSQLSTVNYILKRTQFKEFAGLSAIEDPSLIYPYCQTEVPEEIQAKRDSLKRRKKEKLRATGMLDEVPKIDPQMQLFEMVGSF